MHDAAIQTASKLDQTIPSGTGDRLVAADPETNHVYFPLRPIPTDPACQNGCIGVYAAPNDDRGERHVARR
ncbi:MAG TPA: hypothetical protein VMQ11_17615 [Alphaproteobacteria bacterium]|nr:hypothetical protein [Alphaproteobacteria bacterium]